MEIKRGLNNNWSRNFIIVLPNKDFRISRNQKQALITKFKPSKGRIKIRRSDDETKIFLKTCRSALDKSHVQQNATVILNSQDLIVVKLTKEDVKVLSPYDTQDSSSQSEEHVKKYVEIKIRDDQIKKKSNDLKTQIQIKMESGMKLNEILDQYQQPTDRRMIGDFWSNLQNYEQMLQEIRLKTKQNVMQYNEKDQLKKNSMDLEQGQIINEQIVLVQDKIPDTQHEDHLKFQEFSLQDQKNIEIQQNFEYIVEQNQVENDLKEEEKKHQKIGLIDKTIKKTPIKNNVESVNQLPGVEKFMKKQNQANEINKIKRLKKWELLQKERQEAELLRFQKLKEQNKK